MIFIENIYYLFFLLPVHVLIILKLLIRECGLAHKTIIFVLDEFDLFTQVRFSYMKKICQVFRIWCICIMQGKQRLLYSLLDAMQSVTSQAVVVGVSCRLVCSLIFHFLNWVSRLSCWWTRLTSGDSLNFWDSCLIINTHWLHIVRHIGES